MQNVESLAQAGSLCPVRPPAALYAPERARLLPTHTTSNQGFSMVLVFEEPFDLMSNCTDTHYSCAIGVGRGGEIQEGSAQQLDADGMLYKVIAMGA